jgi:hypothetical protein
VEREGKKPGRGEKPLPLAREKPKVKPRDAKSIKDDFETQNKMMEELNGKLLDLADKI